MEREAKPGWLNLNSGAIFLASGVLAGALNYLFQVVTKRHLSDAEFSQITGWFADLSLLFMLCGVLQDAANFRPANTRALRASLVVINLYFLVATAMWLFLPGVLTLDRAAIAVAAVCMFGWLLGQVQIRLAFGVIALVN